MGEQSSSEELITLGHASIRQLRPQQEALLALQTLPAHLQIPAARHARSESGVSTRQSEHSVHSNQQAMF